MATLRAENLKKSYGNRLVVKGIDIAVTTGEIIALLGRNGAGKTTTFQMMVGLIKPDSGTIMRFFSTVVLRKTEFSWGR